MKLDTVECTKALENYPARTDMEKMAVKVLLTKAKDVYELKGIGRLPSIEDMLEIQIDELAGVIKRIRNELEIEEV